MKNLFNIKLKYFFTLFYAVLICLQLKAQPDCDCKVILMVHNKNCNEWYGKLGPDTCCLSQGWEISDFSKALIDSTFAGNFMQISRLAIESPSSIISDIPFDLFVNLEWLDLYGTDGDGLVKLPRRFFGMKNIKIITIRGISIPDEQIKQIKESYPNTTVEVNKRSQFEPSFKH